MKILLKRDEFSATHYDLRIGDAALEFVGESAPFSVRYLQINDFVITTDSREKSYFTMACAGQMYEGRILSPEDIETFSVTLKEKLDGIVQIDIRKK